MFHTPNQPYVPVMTGRRETIDLAKACAREAGGS